MNEKMSTSDSAVFHIVRRVSDSASFAWLMIGTESLALCIRAVAEYRGEPEADVRKRVEANAASLRDEPEVVKLRKRVEQLERKLDKQSEEENEPDSVYIDSILAIEELIRLAECGHNVLTIDNLKDAMNKPSALHVLR